LVEKALEPLCKAQGWKLVQKNCCVRVELDAQSHLDIAPYAIPDRKYEVLIEKAIRVDATYDTALLAYDEFADNTYRALATIRSCSRSTRQNGQDESTNWSLVVQRAGLTARFWRKADI
jgi:hypothetical protein